MTLRTHHQPPQKDYAELLARVEQAGLFERTRFPYFLTGSIALAGLIGSLSVVTLTDNLLIQILNGVAFGFFGTQLGIIGHDLSSTAFYRYFFGGLDSQIEHHLFPHMSRYQFTQARAIVKKYCAENGLTYHETSCTHSFSEIYESLKDEAHIWKHYTSKHP